MHDLAYSTDVAEELHLDWHTVKRLEMADPARGKPGVEGHWESTRPRIVPPYVPRPRGAVLVTGLLELLGAAGVAMGSARRAAGIGLFALTLLVTPANFFMLQRPDLFHIPVWILIARLPLQVALLVLIAWSTIAKGAGQRASSSAIRRPDRPR